MAPPVASPRQPPAGIKIDDGYQTLVSFATAPDIAFWEKSITPPGLDGGDPIDTTTMHNIQWRSMAPRQLVSMTPFTMTAAYDPALYTTLLGLLNVNTTVTVLFPDGSTLAFFGFLRSFEPGELAEGAQPTATINVVPSNQDPTTG